MKALLQSTLAEGSTLSIYDKPHTWPQLLDQFGTALITEFIVLPGFGNDAEKHHVGFPTGSCLNEDGLPCLYVTV